MLDFTSFRQEMVTFADLARTISYADLHELTDEMSFPRLPI